jgi:hypothetical protein
VPQAGAGVSYPDPAATEDNNTVVFDFDDTLAEGVWPLPGVGPPIPEGLDMLRYYQDQGHRIMIHTARHWAGQHDIELFLLEQLGLERALQIQVICGKPLGALYIDDRGFRFEREEGVQAGQRVPDEPKLPSSPPRTVRRGALFDEPDIVDPELSGDDPIIDRPEDNADEEDLWINL